MIAQSKAQANASIKPANDDEAACAVHLFPNLSTLPGATISNLINNGGFISVLAPMSPDGSKILTPHGVAGIKALTLALIRGGREYGSYDADETLVELDRRDTESYRLSLDLFGELVSSKQLTSEDLRYAVYDDTKIEFEAVRSLGLAVIGQLLADAIADPKDDLKNGDDFASEGARKDARYFVETLYMRPKNMQQFSDWCDCAQVDRVACLDMLNRFFFVTADHTRPMVSPFGAAS